MSIKQISVFVENKPGALSAMTQVLADNGVDMRALSLAKVYDATTALKDAVYVHSVTPVVGAAIPDAPGGLDQVLRVLSGAGVNVEEMYAFLGGKDVSHAYMIFRVEDPAAAEAALTKQGIHVVNQDEMDAL